MRHRKSLLGWGGIVQAQRGWQASQAKVKAGIKGRGRTGEGGFADVGGATDLGTNVGGAS